MFTILTHRLVICNVVVQEKTNVHPEQSCFGTLPGKPPVWFPMERSHLTKSKRIAIFFFMPQRWLQFVWNILKQPVRKQCTIQKSNKTANKQPRKPKWPKHTGCSHKINFNSILTWKSVSNYLKFKQYAKLFFFCFVFLFTSCSEWRLTMKKALCVQECAKFLFKAFQ